MKLPMDKARFVVRVMDSLREHPSLLKEDVRCERDKLDVLYESHGRFSEGSEMARALWLIDFFEAASAALSARDAGEGEK